MSYVTEKMKLLDEIEREMLDNIDFLNRRVLSAVNKKLMEFEIKAGRFVDGTEAPVLVADLKKEIRSIINSKDYQTKFAAWLKNYDQITKLNIQIQKKVNKLNLTKTMFSDAKKTSVDKVLADLVGAGVDVNFIAPLTEGLMRNVVLGATVKDTQNFLESYIVGDDETDGKLNKYAGQLARDSVSQFDGQINQQIMNDHEMDGFAYVGSVVSDSRPFCVHVVEQMDGFISEKELPALLKQFLNSDSKGRGMIDGTTPETFAVFRGGWNCRHAAIPVYKENLEEVA